MLQLFLIHAAVALSVIGMSLMLNYDCIVAIVVI